MAEVNFSEYQKHRTAAEGEVKATILDWALTEAADELTMEQVRSLADRITTLSNRHNKQAYDIGKGS